MACHFVSGHASSGWLLYLAQHLFAAYESPHFFAYYYSSAESCRDLAAAAGVESVLPAKLVKGSIERADEWKSTIIDKPAFETHEGCVAKEVWKRALV